MNYKKILCCLLVLLCLSGCGGAPKALPQSEAFHEESTAQTNSEAQAEINRDANFVFTQTFAQAVCGNEIGAYSVEPRQDGTYQLVYIDYATATKTVVCSSPECSHADVNCTGWIATYYNIPRVVLWGERILLLYPGNSQYGQEFGALAQAKVVSLAPNATDARVLCTFPSTDTLLDNVVLAQDALYMLASFAQEKDAALEEGKKLLRVSLSSGQVEVVEQFPANSSVFLQGATANGLLLKTIDSALSAENLPATKEEWNDAFLNQTHTVWLLHPAQKEKTQVLQWKQNTLVEQYQNGTIVFLKNRSEIHVLDAMTGEETVAPCALPVPEQAVLMGVAVVDHCMVVQAAFAEETEGAFYKNYSIDTRTGAVTPCTLSMGGNAGTNDPVLILAQTADKLLVRHQMDNTPTLVSGPDGSQSKEMVLTFTDSLLKKSDYLTGTAAYQAIQSVRP